MNPKKTIFSSQFQLSETASFIILAPAREKILQIYFSSSQRDGPVLKSIKRIKKYWQAASI
jgi:hypothetical protein